MLKITRGQVYSSAIPVVLTALSMKIQVFWDINPFYCLPVDMSQCPRGLECRHMHTLCTVWYFIIVHNALLAHSCVTFKLAGLLIAGNRREVLIKAV